MMKGVDRRIDKGVLHWFGHVERMENDRIAKRVYVEEYAGSCSVGRVWKSWIDTMEVCLKKRGLDVRQARRYNRSVWPEFASIYIYIYIYSATLCRT